MSIDAAGPGTVLDHHVGLQRFLHVGRRDATHHIGIAARRERHDELDQPVRVGFLCRRSLQDSERGQHCHGGNGSFHFISRC
jgi:hypothetical protein